MYGQGWMGFKLPVFKGNNVATLIPDSNVGRLLRNGVDLVGRWFIKKEGRKFPTKKFRGQGPMSTLDGGGWHGMGGGSQSDLPSKFVCLLDDKQGGGGANRWASRD
jgi:hypothetical protein